MSGGSLLGFKVVPATWPYFYEFDRDATFKRLTADMPEREVAFAMRYSLNNNAARAMLETEPEMQPTSAKTAGSRMLNKERVVALVEYLKTLEPASDEPLSVKEMITKLEQMFRTNNDPKVALALAEKIVAWRGLDIDELRREAKEQKERELKDFITGLQKKEDGDTRHE